MTLFIYKFNLKQQCKIPKPTDYMLQKKARKEFTKRRREWIERMHRTAPGVNWRRMDQETRQRKNKEKLAERAALVAGGKFNGAADYVETVADGELQGIWKERGSNNLSGRMMTLDVDFSDGLIYAGSAGGNIWVGDLNGNNWNSINDYLQFNEIIMVRRLPYGNGKRLIVAQKTPPKIYFTDDDGLTWHSAGGLGMLGNNGQLIRCIVLNDVNHTLYLLGSSNQSSSAFYKSTDQGQSFTKIADFNHPANRCDLWTPRYGSPKVYILGSDKIYRRGPGDIPSAFGTIPISGFSLSSIYKTNLTGCAVGSSVYLYALYGSGGDSHIYGSDNGGYQWTSNGILSGETPFARNSFACSNQNPGWLYCGGTDCFRSYDGGQNWTRYNHWWEYYSHPESKLHADIPGIDVVQNPQGDEFALISTDGGIFASYDSTTAVYNISMSGLRISQYYDTYTNRNNPLVVFAASQDQGFQRTLHDPGNLINFNQLISGDYSHIVSGDGGSSVWTVYPSFALYFPFASTISSQHFSWNFVGNNYLWMPPLMEDPDSSGSVYLGGGGSSGGAHIWHLSFGSSGISAQELPYNFAGSAPYVSVSAMAYSPLNPDYRYVLTSNGRFFYSFDAGISWTHSQAFNGPPGHWLFGSAIVASPVTPGRVYIAGSGYSNPPVYVSDDHGATFNSLSSGLPHTMVYDLAATQDDKFLFAASEVGPFVYVDSLGSWFDLAGISGPDQTYFSVDYVPAINTARFATYGRGIWDFQMGSSTAISPKEITSVIPMDLELTNYPNPFNSSTTINYRINKAGPVEIEIYTTTGQLVRRLVNAPQAAGTHRVTWDGFTSSGKQAASGLYIYRLKTGNDQLTKRMIMVK